MTPNPPEDTGETNNEPDADDQVDAQKRDWRRDVSAAARNVRDMSGDNIYLGVTKIMLSPQTLIENADRACEREAKRLGMNPKSEYVRDAAIRRVIKHYARLAGATSGGTALTGIIPGVGTATTLTLGVGTDLVVTLKLQAEMSLQIAHLYGSDIATEEAKHLAFMLSALGATANAGQEALSKTASKAMTRLTERHLSGATLLGVKMAFRNFGVVFTRKALVKVIPFGVGAGVGYVTGQILTRKVGKEITRHYAVPSTGKGTIIDADDAVFRDLTTEEE
jgi:uncharacterized protein (DUF697 family)